MRSNSSRQLGTAPSRRKRLALVRRNKVEKPRSCSLRRWAAFGVEHSKSHVESEVFRLKRGVGSRHEKTWRSEAPLDVNRQGVVVDSQRDAAGPHTEEITAGLERLVKGGAGGQSYQCLSAFNQSFGLGIRRNRGRVGPDLDGSV